MSSCRHLSFFRRWRNRKGVIHSGTSGFMLCFTLKYPWFDECKKLAVLICLDTSTINKSNKIIQLLYSYSIFTHFISKRHYNKYLVLSYYSSDKHLYKHLEYNNTWCHCMQMYFNFLSLLYWYISFMIDSLLDLIQVFSPNIK